MTLVDRLGLRASRAARRLGRPVEVRTLPVPEELLVPFDARRQRLAVTPGARRAEGETLIEPTETEAVGALAPTAVEVIGERGIGATTVLVVRPHGPTSGRAVLPPIGADAKALIARARAAGVRGHGGSGFATFRKLEEARERRVHTLVVNAVECEPELASDAALVAAEPDGVIAGARAVADALGVTRTVVAVEAPDTVGDGPTAFEVALSEAGLERLAVGASYPAGDERMLTRQLTGRAPAIGERPTALGCLVLNVATVHALGALAHGRIPAWRYVTVALPGASSQPVVRVMQGTAAEAVMAAVRPPLPSSPLAEGGAMMPRALHDQRLPVGAATTGLRAMPAEPPPASPCIRCGLCVPVCPAGLAPDRLWARVEADDLPGIETLGVQACTGCRCCDVVCPSSIGLAAAFARVSTALDAAASAKVAAEHARIRYERHETRTRARAERAAERRTRPARGASRGAVEAIVARARRRRETPVTAESSAAGVEGREPPADAKDETP